MLTDFVISRIRAELPFTPNGQQEQLLEKLGHFIVSQEADRVFLLRGYAGTGKTSVMAALVRAMHKLNHKTVLLAPTGRAAKVLSAHAGFPAYTIHKRIYRQKNMGKQTFSLSFNAQQDTLFVVDEASMISNRQGENRSFGTGCLLDDLLQYVFSGNRCALILIGDNAQLPPVGQQDSPALDPDNLLGYGLQVTEHTLTEVARQALESGILFNATRLRRQLAEGDVERLPVFVTEGFDDIRHLNGEEMTEEIERSYREAGVEETMVVTHTNRRMNLYNQGIRARILWKEDELSGGERLMVIRNNYYFTRQYEGIDFLANGDIFEVIRVRNRRELYGFRFADASLRAVDYDWEIDVILWLDILGIESPEAAYPLQQQLFQRIAEDYPEIRSRKELAKTVLESPYYNALQVKHAYAVTCHKAQGGQWERVFIDQGPISEDQLGSDYYRWLYTALTRASKQVYLINFTEKSPNKAK
ncbi:MAG: AAA family ATPase [Paludibacteraceae bacterium]|nr:AAA family ATPase [Paludibacteraceae bacterium]